MSSERKPYIPPPTDTTRPYTELPVPEYWIFLKYLNQQYIDQAQRLLSSAPITGDQCLVLLGSDGKRERHAQSKTDLAIVQRSKTPGNLTPSGLMDWFDQTHIENFKDVFDLQLHDEPEVKEIGNPDLYISDAYPYIYQGVNRRIYPDRALNTVFVLGNEDVFVEARRQVLNEMTANHKRSGTIRRELVKQLKSYRKTMETGLYRDRPTFTVEPPVQFYDEDLEVYSTGFKIGFLRTVQRFLDVATIVGIREGYFTIDEAVTELPTSCPERIQYLASKGLFTDEILTERSIDAYLWFLQQYHFAQEQYKNERTPIALPFSQEDFTAYAGILEEFTSKGYYSVGKNFLTNGD